MHSAVSKICKYIDGINSANIIIIVYLSWIWATCWPVPVSRISEVSLKVYHDSFCQLWSSVSLPWVIYFETFYLHVLSSFSCIPVTCTKLVLFLTPLQFVYLFFSLSQVYSAVIFMYFISTAVILLVSLALIVQVSLPYNKLYPAFLVFKENLSGFFPWDLTVVKISPEWVTGPEQGKSSGRIATFSLWTGMFKDGISSIPGETVIPLWLGRHFLVCKNRVYHEKVRMSVG